MFNLSACREVLRSFSLSDSETTVEQNLCHAHAHHESLMYQNVAAEDAPEVAWLLDAQRQSMEQIIEEDQGHRVQVAALSQMKLETMERWRPKKRSCRDLVLCWSIRHFWDHHLKGPTKKLLRLHLKT